MNSPLQSQSPGKSTRVWSDYSRLEFFLDGMKHMEDILEVLSTKSTWHLGALSLNCCFILDFLLSARYDRGKTGGRGGRRKGSKFPQVLRK